MSHYKLLKVENNVGVFVDKETNIEIRIPNRNFTEKQKHAMAIFSNQKSKYEFKVIGNC